VVAREDWKAPERELRILDAAGVQSGRHLGRPVVVTWEDIFSVTEESDGRPPGQCLCRTYGLCTYDGPDYLSVAAEELSNPGGGMASYRGTTHIIRAVIRNITELT